MTRRMLMAVVAALLAAGSLSAQTSGGEGATVAWLQSFDRAFMAKDLDKLSSFYHPDVTIFEGGGVRSAPRSSAGRR